MERRADDLLPEGRHMASRPSQRYEPPDAVVAVRTAVAVDFCRIGGTGVVGRAGRALLGLGLDQAVEFALQAAEAFEQEHEADDADAGAGEHAVGGDVPCRGEEARVDGVPVPEHLSWPK